VKLLALNIVANVTMKENAGNVKMSEEIDKKIHYIFVTVTGILVHHIVPYVYSFVSVYCNCVFSIQD
jgi:hypothetical protein